MKLKVSEHQIQVSFVEWFKLQYPKKHRCILAIPNGRKCSVQLMRYLKAEGLQPGVSDILITMKGRKRMLWIEFKSEIGKLSPNQIEFIEAQQDEDCECVVCRSFEEARKALMGYLS